MSSKHVARDPIGLVFGPKEASDTFVKLFSVTVTHSYYTLNGALCPDFRTSPTPSTSALMASLGMIFKNEAAGFSVFIQHRKLRPLIAYLRRTAQEPDGSSGFWGRLSFSMRLTNPLFVGITALPIDTKTTQLNLYGCNEQAHQEAGMAILPAGSHMGAEALYPVIGSEVTLTLPPTAKRVTVTDISGAIVIPAPDADEVPLFPTREGPDSPKRAMLDFSGLPYDLYTISVVDAEQRPVETKAYPRTVLYVAAQPDGMVLLDMLFTQPTPDSAGIYPIPPLFDADADVDLAKCGHVAYRLPFDARRTYWQYFVVSQNPGGQLCNLQIEGQGSGFRQEAQPVLLPNGSSAVLFKADTPLPLRQKSLQHFQLSGQRRDADGQENAIRISRLPVAAGAPVWPAPAAPGTSGISEIYVYV